MVMGRLSLWQKGEDGGEGLERRLNSGGGPSPYPLPWEGRGERHAICLQATGYNNVLQNTRGQPGSHEEITALRRYFESQN